MQEAFEPTSTFNNQDLNSQNDSNRNDTTPPYRNVYFALQDLYNSVQKWVKNPGPISISNLAGPMIFTQKEAQKALVCMEHNKESFEFGKEVNWLDDTTQIVTTFTIDQSDQFVLRLGKTEITFNALFIFDYLQQLKRDQLTTIHILNKFDQAELYLPVYPDIKNKLGIFNISVPCNYKQIPPEKIQSTFAAYYEPDNLPLPQNTPCLDTNEVLPSTYKKTFPENIQFSDEQDKIPLNDSINNVEDLELDINVNVSNQLPQNNLSPDANDNVDSNNPGFFANLFNTIVTWFTAVKEFFANIIGCCFISDIEEINPPEGNDTSYQNILKHLPADQITKEKPTDTVTSSISNPHLTVSLEQSENRALEQEVDSESPSQNSNSLNLMRGH